MEPQSTRALPRSLDQLSNPHSKSWENLREGQFVVCVEQLRVVGVEEFGGFVCGIEQADNRDVAGKVLGDFGQDVVAR